MTYENRIAETLGIAAEDGIYAVVADGRVAVVISYSKADAGTFTGEGVYKVGAAHGEPNPCFGSYRVGRRTANATSESFSSDIAAAFAARFLMPSRGKGRSNADRVLAFSSITSIYQSLEALPGARGAAFADVAVGDTALDAGSWRKVMGRPTFSDTAVIHTFSDTGEAYDACQCDDAIKTGDLLVIDREHVVGIADTWPLAATPNAGALHALLDPSDGPTYFTKKLGADRAREVWAQALLAASQQARRVLGTAPEPAPEPADFGPAS
mgnify:CR=1 FL=1